MTENLNDILRLWLAVSLIAIPSYLLLRRDIHRAPWWELIPFALLFLPGTIVFLLLACVLLLF